ncbi:ubiquinol-cytochrome c reductase complex assembly factor 4 [Paramormyrops kingsleyae]|uniref:Ubiquinol-cytochrome c reductase complex assembly factor 4 n=1 Tax=Paramormyrops kingsleyae TaxID=1676925 RepID=A0A3B3RXB7_9TELE
MLRVALGNVTCVTAFLTMFRLTLNGIRLFKPAGSCYEALFGGSKTKLMSQVTWRSMFLTCERCCKSQSPENTEDMGKPIKFSTSKASHRTWRVDRSLGSQHQRPWWKVLPVSLAIVCFLLWCAFRDESEIDQKLEKQLYEHLSGLSLDEDKEDDTNKKDS